MESSFRGQSLQAVGFCGDDADVLAVELDCQLLRVWPRIEPIPQPARWQHSCEERERVQHESARGQKSRVIMPGPSADGRTTCPAEFPVAIAKPRGVRDYFDRGRVRAFAQAASSGERGGTGGLL